ncbi:Alpha,alpha-trehalose-phosphate synthase (UDP-forming) [Beutenbergia cavernae DSM 12333]|uniref:Alpha,alpha-trehalose-phosphate synthase (UDP-forming) n=1 Tax=Beutenbergia cavernae (strain ATCC BAA-8 / DSM 12333 / CCUG 43141 / JCM 11478 / NBRC 16432 / NCIMB 13614 / HKI 0122) TaxID=471853 RepID=C5BYU9_BEUC1|nr:trehalose-6-phosphate synthase [Beutenbergia cavernae]ACQ79057.1 Alpha,alpha-trehalose-phosphate synthase (UDP-forming) [Beutenbergia cavernae DSM 12333]
MPSGPHEFVVVANRLPVDVSVPDEGREGEISWSRSPGGLVSALQPVMQKQDGAWVGWSGTPDLTLDPFDADGMRLCPVPLSGQEVEEYYEGLSNGTLWPLYHDVIVDPEYHRLWWNSYVTINRRFAHAAAEVAAEGGTVWVHDYQLQLVPSMLRTLRPDVRIGFFNHIPFPSPEIFSQLPWRKQIVEGLLGADLVGFQRGSDAANFLRSVRRLTDLTTRGQVVTIGSRWARPERHVRAAAFPISIDALAISELAQTEPVMRRAVEIRHELGDPDVLMLGVDRLDYTKGIGHRLKAFGELLRDGALTAPETTLVQVASPSRERVEQYRVLRDEVEGTVGRINGDYGVMGRPAVHYLHHSYPTEEMVALYLASDVMLVTALRDGMNLVAKEYVAARTDLGGVLVLSEFAGAADELSQALLVNPHDIDGVKQAIVRAIEMEPKERRRRMRALRKRVLDNDVQHWADSFLSVLTATPRRDSHV